MGNVISLDTELMTFSLFDIFPQMWYNSESTLQEAEL